MVIIIKKDDDNTGDDMVMMMKRIIDNFNDINKDNDNNDTATTTTIIRSNIPEKIKTKPQLLPFPGNAPPWPPPGTSCPQSIRQPRKTCLLGNMAASLGTALRCLPRLLTAREAKDTLRGRRSPRAARTPPSGS